MQLVSYKNHVIETREIIFDYELALIFLSFFTQILQDYSSYDLTRPMPGLTDDQHRSVIHEGNLRLLEKQGKVSKRHY